MADQTYEEALAEATAQAEYEQALAEATAQAEAEAAAELELSGSTFNEPSSRDDSGRLETAWTDPGTLIQDFATAEMGAFGKQLGIRGATALAGTALGPIGKFSAGTLGAVLGALGSSYITDRPASETIPSALGGALFSTKPILAPVRKAQGRLDPYTYSKIGGTTYKNLVPDEKLAEAIDPNAYKLTAAIQPTITTFEEGTQVSVHNRLKELQQLGYFKDVKSIKDLYDKVQLDFGKEIPKSYTLPDGTIDFTDVYQPGRAHQLYTSLANKLTTTQVEKKIPSLTLADLKKRAFAEAKSSLIESKDYFTNLKDLISFIDQELNDLTENLAETSLVRKSSVSAMTPFTPPKDKDIILPFNILNEIKISSNRASRKFQEALVQEAPLRGQALKSISDTLLKLEEEQAKKIGGKAYPAFMKTKRFFELGIGVRKHIEKAFGRIVNEKGGGNSVRLPGRSSRDLINRILEYITPHKTSDEIFAQTQAAARLRGLPAPAEGLDFTLASPPLPSLGYLKGFEPQYLGSLGLKGTGAVISGIQKSLPTAYIGAGGVATGEFSRNLVKEAQAANFVGREFQAPRDKSLWDIDPMLLAQLNFEPQDLEQFEQLREAPEQSKEAFLSTLTKKYPTFFQRSPIPGFNVVEGKIMDGLEALTYAQTLKRKIKDPVILARYLSPLNEDGTVFELLTPIPKPEEVRALVPELVGGVPTEIRSPTMGNVKRNEASY